MARPGGAVAVLEPVADEPSVDDASADDAVSDASAVEVVVVDDEIPADIEFAPDEPVIETGDGLFDDLDEDSDLYDADPVNSGPIGRGGSSPIDPLLGR